jgi:uncharacterized membrane protein
MKISRYHIIFALVAVSLIFSILLSVEPASQICSANSGCELVYYSQYNSFLGIHNSYYGIAIFSLLILLMISHFIKPAAGKKALINLSVILGSLAALYFLCIQSFVLHAFCKYCIIVDFSMLACLALVVPELKKGFSELKAEKGK